MSFAVANEIELRYGGAKVGFDKLNVEHKASVRLNGKPFNFCRMRGVPSVETARKLKKVLSRQEEGDKGEYGIVIHGACSFFCASDHEYEQTQRQFIQGVLFTTTDWNVKRRTTLDVHGSSFSFPGIEESVTKQMAVSWSQESEAFIRDHMFKASR